MSKFAHRIYISILVIIVILASIGLLYKGLSFYSVSLEERFYHPDYALLKPSGILGHGVGIIGSLLIIIGVGSYMIRKRNRSLFRLGVLKHWLEFHIFLCTLGPVLVLYHTSFKFGGLVAISFWSMVAVFLSGIIGRFIYIQIPRTIQGRELNLNEIRAMKSDVATIARNTYNLDDEGYNIITDSTKKKVELYHRNALVRLIRKYLDDRKSFASVKKVLKKNKIPKNESKTILNLVKNDIVLNRKIERLDTMHNLFKYWHVVHSPFALIMLIIMVIHVVITITLGYKWIF